MNILIPVLQFGKSGGFRVLSKLADNWISKGHSVDFISPIANIPPYFPTTANVVWVNHEGEFCTQDHLIDEDKYSMYKRWKSLIKGIKRLNKHYDIALANHSLSTFPLILSGTKAKKYYYIQAYEPEYYQSFEGSKARVLAFLSWCSYFLPLRRIVNADLYKKYKNIRSDMVVYPGLDLNTFQPRPKLNNEDKKKKIRLNWKDRIIQRHQLYIRWLLISIQTTS